MKPVKWLPSQCLVELLKTLSELCDKPELSERQTRVFAVALELLCSLLDRFGDFSPVLIPLLIKLVGTSRDRGLLKGLLDPTWKGQVHNDRISASTCRVATAVVGIIESLRGGTLSAFGFQKKLRDQAPNGQVFVEGLVMPAAENETLKMISEYISGGTDAPAATGDSHALIGSMLTFADSPDYGKQPQFSMSFSIFWRVLIASSP